MKALLAILVCCSIVGALVLARLLFEAEVRHEENRYPEAEGTPLEGWGLR